ncbi:hypothetical protein EJ02DRAFT_116604 [Clathrospora elynae]|uniref:Galactosyl transferase GMA12/MNN10 family protein n=1 Tax=Clathrospora elynae TaxID=706981 RepID=A0A6A5S6I5_9PLEO|nr:hypothetical protein EJ02DRAFT_116604 [Clathrospora elynae]
MTRSGFTMTPLGSIVPKILLAVLTLAIFYQLSWHSSDSDPKPTTLGDSAGSKWFQGAVKAPQRGDKDDSPAAELPPPLDYNRTHISYGPTQCMPTFNDKLKHLALARNESCATYAPFPVQESRRVAFASITTGQPAEAYQRAILSQMFHSAVHGTSTHVLCEQLSDGAWNKIAFLLNLVMNEMLKPQDERLEWIMWIDRDAILLDACRPLSNFVPPATPEFDKINLITNNDSWGLNAGVFIFRVNEWSIQLFNTILAFRYFRPDEELILAEQTAMEKIISEEKFKDGVVRVPWYWFNAYPDEGDSVKSYRDGLEPNNLEWFRARKGDFVVHFAGDDGRNRRMPDWLDMLQDLGNVWENGDALRDITSEISSYWNSWKSGSLTDVQITGEPEEDDGETFSALISVHV